MAGAILANAIADAMDEPKLPTLVISPNEAVQVQWKDTLLRNGVPLNKIVLFRKGGTSGFSSDNFILLTRYTAQSVSFYLKDLFMVLSRKKETSGRKKDTIVFLYKFPMNKVYADVLDFDSYLRAGYNLILLDMTRIFYPDVYKNYYAGRDEYIVKMD